MTDQRDKVVTEPACGVGLQGADQAVGISRRAVLRGATAVVPTILTLKSGTALAVASNHVTESVNPDVTNNQYVALNTTGQTGPAYDYSNGEALFIPVALYVDDRTLTIDQRDQLIAGTEVKNLTVLTGDELCPDPTDPTYQTGLPVRYHRVESRVAGSNVFYRLVKSDDVPQCAYLSVAAWTSVSSSGQVTATPLF